MPRLLASAALLLLGSVLVLAREPATAKRPVLPGIRPNGSVQLPNQWSLRPAGKQLQLGDFPVHLALHPSGKWLAVLHAGFGTHEIMTIDLQKQKLVARVNLDQTWYGLTFSPDGKTLFASGAEYEVVHSYAFEDGLLFHHRAVPVGPVKEKFIPGGLAVGPDGKKLFVAGTWGGAVRIVPLDDPDRRDTVAFGKDSYPYAVLLDAAGKRLFVSLWAKAAVAVINVPEKKLEATWPTEKHPTEMALAPDGKTLYVTCANSTKVSVLDTDTGKGRQTINCALYPAAPSGNTPSSLCLTPDGKMLFVANADANNVAVFSVANPGQAQPLGFIPAGWYPTSVRYNAKDKRLYIANGKGNMPKANVQGPQPSVPRGKTFPEYIGALFRGTLSIVNQPTPAAMARYSKDAYACSPLRKDFGPSAEAEKDNPIPRKVGDPSPIKHVIYIIKENRTYDQFFGDMKEGNGDASLCLFPEKVTPNHHKLAREFVLLDNFYVDGEVSADGHQWSMGAYCTDYVEKVWPLTYRGSRKGKLSFYPSEGQGGPLEPPAGGYIWDRCAEAKISYRSYGEWVANGKTPKDPGKPLAKALVGHIDPWYRSFDLNYPDQKRADRFLEELKGFENKGEMPRFMIVRLPNDHTQGTKVGAPTPTAYMADNDLALGRVVEAISRSKFWKDTAIFVIEDDAQNGPDHVDAHRTVALVISPYTRHGFVDSGLYSTTSMLRTMELILGLKPMSQFDAAARPMYASFQARPDVRPYQHVVPQADLKEKNRRTAWGARRSARMDFTKEDRVDDLLLNEVIWKSVRGPKSVMPPPVRAAFVFPHLKKKDKDDDD